MLLSKAKLFRCDFCEKIMTQEQITKTHCSSDKAHFFLAQNGKAMRPHLVTKEKVNLEALVRFLRDEKRICWAEIYFKI